MAVAATVSPLNDTAAATSSPLLPGSPPGSPAAKVKVWKAVTGP